MLGVRLKNPGIVLMPITEEEKNSFESDNSLYVLYKLKDSEDINIGMMASYMQKYYPGLANVFELDNAVTKAFFYSGGSNLKYGADEVNDRPVYIINPDDDRVVDSYEIINNVNVSLEDVVDGNYTIGENIKTR